VWRGIPGRRALALTFDDGPSPATPAILATLGRYGVRATFFQIGKNAGAHPEIARRCRAEGHEIGNHSQTHPNFALRAPDFVLGEFSRAQEVLSRVTGQTPRFLRAPYGVRWFGFARAQQQLGLGAAMWTVIGRDWKLPAADVAARILARATDGDIICLHDGRGTETAPDASSTVEAVRMLVPTLLEKGYHFETVTEILCPKK